MEAVTIILERGGSILGVTKMTPDEYAKANNLVIHHGSMGGELCNEKGRLKHTYLLARMLE